MSVKSKTWTCKSIWRGRPLSKQTPANRRSGAKCQTHPNPRCELFSCTAVAQHLQASTSGKLLSPCNLAAGMHKTCTSAKLDQASEPDVIRQTYEHLDVGEGQKQKQSIPVASEHPESCERSCQRWLGSVWKCAKRMRNWRTSNELCLLQGCVELSLDNRSSSLTAHMHSVVWDIIWTLTGSRTFVCYLKQNGNIPWFSCLLFLFSLLAQKEPTNTD